MKLSERWLASEQRHAMSYERWLEYVATDAETQAELDQLDAQRYRKIRAAFEKAEESDFPMHEAQMLIARLSVDFDGTADELPDPNANPDRSR